MSTYFEFFFLFGIAIIGGALNTCVSGAWFIVFPSLIYKGIQPVTGNATTAMILWSGQIVTSAPIKKNHEIAKKNVQYMIWVCALGGLLGAILLGTLSHKIFEKIAPYLLLCSWFLFVFYYRILRYISSRFAERKRFRYSHAQLIPLFLLGVYGGYFGAGMGMIIFALYRFYGIKSNDTLEGLMIVLVSINNGIAVFVYIWAGLIYWPFALIMIVGAILGGYVGGALAQKIDTAVVKKILNVIAAVVTLYFLNLINLNSTL